MGITKHGLSQQGGAYTSWSQEDIHRSNGDRASDAAADAAEAVAVRIL